VNPRTRRYVIPALLTALLVVVVVVAVVQAL